MAGDVGDKALLHEISPKFTEDTLVAILRKASGADDIELVKYELGSGSTRGGDSYLSSLYRLNLVGKIGTKTYPLAIIVKSLPKNIGRRKTFRSVEFFRNEVAFYNEVLPKFLEFQQERKPKKPFKEIPRCLFALADGDNDFVAMEDVSAHGYKTADRKQGADLDHCVLMLQTLGRLHALSLAMKDQDPDGFKSIVSRVKETYWCIEYKPWYQGQMKVFIKVAMDAVSKEYPNSVYEEKLRQFTDGDLYERMCKFSKPKEPTAVIGHGDTWAPNFLFAYSDDKCSNITGVQVIDFQLARYGSPVLDFSFFFFSCTTEDLRRSHFKQLIDAYYHSMSEFLEDLGSSPDSLFSYETFQKELKAYMQFGLGFSLESIPFSIMDESEAPDIDLIEGDEAVPLEKVWHVAPIKDKKGRLRLANNIKFAVDNGYL